MRPFTVLAILAALFSSCAVFAAELTFEQRARVFAADRYDDALTLINGPQLGTPPPVDPAAGCAALYARRMALQRTMDDRNPAYWDDPRNQAAVFLGTVWTPAFYFLGYSAVNGHLDSLSADDPQAEIDALRRASAALRCFEGNESPSTLRITAAADRMTRCSVFYTDSKVGIIRASSTNPASGARQSMFESLSALPADPILGLMAAFRADTNELKVDLGVGVYRDDDGATPILTAVAKAQARHNEAETTKTYIGPPGEPEFNDAMQALLFGSDHPVLREGRIGSAQTPGGCGALRVAAELANRARPGARVWVSDPTWANHVPLLGDAGLTIETYPYFDRSTNGLRFDDMMSTLAATGPEDIVLLHGCCHNPCGVDLSEAQWDAVAALAVERGFTPFIDIAYQGLSTGIEEDAYGVRKMAASVPELIVASSCSKNFGLYRERVGCVAVMSPDAGAKATVLSQMLNVIRGIYSMPPNHGGAIVRTILRDPALRQEWLDELASMRDRINGLRDEVATKLAARIGSQRFDFIRDQRGMFSFLGIDKDQIIRLREESSIYMVDSSRINVAGLNSANIDYVCDAIARVL